MTGKRGSGSEQSGFIDYVKTKCDKNVYISKEATGDRKTSSTFMNLWVGPKNGNAYERKKIVKRNHKFEMLIGALEKKGLKMI